MKNYITHHPWKIIEEGFDATINRNSESIFSIGNGQFGQRANFEETYSGDSLRGNYVAGVYYPDKTRVGWWKNGYPEYFAKVLNAPDWICLELQIGDEVLDLHNWEVSEFRRELDMQQGLLSRSFQATSPNGTIIRVSTERLISLADDETAALHWSLESVNFKGRIQIRSLIDGDVRNEDANYDEQFWEAVSESSLNGTDCVVSRTKKTNFEVAVCTQTRVARGDELLQAKGSTSRMRSTSEYQTTIRSGDTLVIEKFAGIISSLNADDTLEAAQTASNRAYNLGFSRMKQLQEEAWNSTWEVCDIEIEGDIAAQQGIRFNIFQLFQTYTGKDARFNIGPKGFTGEKYGGSTYWDTEAYCIPFYLSTSDQQVARNLLQYRYDQLDKAIENAAKLGFGDGAALYPMVTMNGEECHNEWEITFEEIHRNGAIAYAIYEYTEYTGDATYLYSDGMDVLVGISRFWQQRVNWSEAKKKYVILGVTGPNEYENNVNNNWYTNRIAAWSLEFTCQSLKTWKTHDEGAYEEAISRLRVTDKELDAWTDIVDQMYYPHDPERDVFLQQDGFLDKELVPVSALDPVNLPLNQKWSWDRILRSCYIKQADVLQGLYFLESSYAPDVVQRNFDFYEPITVHESSLSPCIHAILASRLGMQDKAYEMYLRTARLDLDDYNNDTDDGCHITSMAGTWMAVTRGFGGMRFDSEQILFDPFLPGQWEGYRFHILFRGSRLYVQVDSDKVTISCTGQPCLVNLYGEQLQLSEGEPLVRPLVFS